MFLIKRPHPLNNEERWAQRKGRKGAPGEDFAGLRVIPAVQNFPHPQALRRTHSISSAPSSPLLRHHDAGEMAAVTSILLSSLLLLTLAATYASTTDHPLSTLEPVPRFPLARRILAAAKNTSTNSNSSDTSDAKRSKGEVWMWISAFVAGTVAGVLSGLVISLLYRLLMDCIHGRFRDPKGPAIYSPLIRKSEYLAFLEKDDGVAQLDVIGRGGCGEVYRAALPDDPGKLIAIKKIKILNLTDPSMEIGEEESKLLEKGMRQLRSEINTVGHIRHRNLLPLLAHVPRPDCNYLIYEFMKNGSLQDALKKSSEGTMDLPWSNRLRIARGVAAGLEYLHTQQNPRIIHRDLKPANILLDDDMEARIADFGLAKAIPDANTHMTTSNLAGTVGYIAPEYHQMLKFTDKCDIYSFGVILVVLVVGRMPSDEYFQTTEEMSMMMWVRNLMSSAKMGVMEAVDERLKGSGYLEEILLVLKIACFCTLDDPKERPNSKEICIMLEQIKHH